jgi:AcrR family transcriptional regulator
MSEPRAKRPYNSPQRASKALETRRRIRATAERLFVRDGYLPTTMKAIAAEAGVAERTLYLAYATKAELLGEIIRVAVRGHDRDEPLAAGTAFRAVIEASPGELAARFAQSSAELMRRTARVLAIGEAAAAADPALAGLRDRGHAAIRADMREIAGALSARGTLARGMTEERAADVLFAIAANETVYLRLTGECGWSDRDYAGLLERLVQRLLTSDGRH